MINTTQKKSWMEFVLLMMQKLAPNAMQRRKRTFIPAIALICFLFYFFTNNLVSTNEISEFNGTKSPNMLADKVRDMAKSAWDGHYQYARDSDELMPLLRKGYNWTSYPIYMTAVDSLDTLYIMGLKTEYEQAKEIVLTKMDFNKIDEVINHFEVNIRVLGGLLSANEFDPDERYVKKAIDIADRLLTAFDTPTGLPYSRIYLNKPTTEILGSVSIATAGTLQLEFQYLSDLTGNPIYQDKALFVLEQLHLMKKPIPGLFPTAINVNKLEFPGYLRYGIGGENDSFYEYLFKLYVSTGNEKFKNWYQTSAKALLEHVVTKDRLLTYCPDTDQSGRKDYTFHHLSCFAGGMFAYGYRLLNSTNESEWNAGKGITETCMKMNKISSSGLGGETSSVLNHNLAIVDSSYLLRPEVIESVFYMWRFTKDTNYRVHGENMIKKLEEHARDDVGYHTINRNGNPGDKMESFFMAETLKYLFLLFSDDSVVSLDEYVFNTEAHPVSIRGHGLRKDPAKWVPIKATNEYTNLVLK